jgi:membrane protein DedA with SNARE-associated domain
VEFLQDWVKDQVVSYGYVAIFVLMLLNSACIPIPSEVTLLFGGAICSATFAEVALGDPSAQLSFFWVCVWGVAGSMIGSWLAYWMGYAGGRPLIDRWGRYLLFRPHEVDRAHDWFERYGERVVFFGRVLPVIHTFISLPAGVAKMDLRRFSAFTLLGAAIWTVGMTYAGYMLGESWRVVEEWMQPIAWFFVILIAAGIVWWVVKRRRENRASGSVPEG